MNVLRTAALLAAGFLAGCMAGGPSLNAQDPGSAPGSSRAGSGDLLGVPLILDRSDLRIGTTVQFTRAPTIGELHDLTQLPGLAHIVLTFPSWPTDLASLQPLIQVPRGADVVVVVAGYPPNRAAVEAWSYLSAPLRIVVVVPGPPPSVAAVDDLNSMRSLERVIAQMEQPSRSGFERLQRPLSFRKLID